MERPIEALGCDVGGTKVKLARLRRGEVDYSREIPSPRNVSAASFVRTLVGAVEGILEADPPDGEPPPLGVALPGFLDPERRRVVLLSNLPALNGVDLAARLEKRLARRIVLETDTNAGAVGEALLGAGRGFDRLLYVTLGTGLGAALTVEGKPARVSHHTVGQIAHIPLSDHGPPCSCGQTGCAESLLSARGILRRAGSNAPSSTRGLYEAARDGEDGAIAVWRETGELLGRLSRILVALFSPQVVVVGGGIAAAADYFLPQARAYLRRTLPRGSRDSLRLEKASLGPFAGAVGAALIAADTS